MIKRTILPVLCTFAVVLGLSAQQANLAEPKFIGEVMLVQPDGTASLLEKHNAVVKTKAGASLYLVGIGSVKSRIHIPGGAAGVRGKAGAIQLIIRARDNESDPLSIIRIFAFQAKKKERRAVIASSATFSGTEMNNLDLQSFTADRFGEKSYILTLPACPPGEYGVIIDEPNTVSEKNVIVSSFGVD